MKLIGKSSGTGIKKGDVVKYNGEIYLASDSADNDGDIEAVNADQDVFYIHESRLTKVYGVDGKSVTPTITVEMTVDELKVIHAESGSLSRNQTAGLLVSEGHEESLADNSYDIYLEIAKILEEVAK